MCVELLPCLLGHAQRWEFPIQAYGEQTKQNDDKRTGEEQDVLMPTKGVTEYVYPGPGKRAGSAKGGRLEQRRNLVADNVRKDAPKGSGDGPQQNGDEPRLLLLKGDGCAHGREQGHSHGIRIDEYGLDLRKKLGPERKNQADREYCDRVVGIPYPKERMPVEKKISQCSAPKGSDECHADGTDEIHARAGSEQDAVDRRYDNSSEFDENDYIHLEVGHGNKLQCKFERV